MEKLPYNSYPEYYAPSITDFISNEGIILRDHEEWVKSHSIRRISFWVGYGLEIAGLFLARAKWQIPVAAHVEIPFVSHLPIRDKYETSRTLTIFDQTGEMEVVLMERAFKEDGINPESVKRYSWYDKHVMLFLHYTLDPKFNRRYLMSIENYLAPATSLEGVEEMGKNVPILNPEGMIN